jgi:aquaporin Z
VAAKLITELIGTFFLVLTIGLTVLGEVPLAPVAIGAVLMVMVYMGGSISGGHFNPAVTLAVWLRGILPTAQVGPYMGAQVLGALLAAGVVVVVMGAPLVVAPAATTSFAAFVGLEFLFTFALCLVVLNTATAPEVAGNSYYGLAIGFTVMVGAFAAGPLTGGAFNPAVVLGPAVVAAASGAVSLPAVGVYLAAALAAGALAAGVYRVQHPAPVPPATI